MLRRSAASVAAAVLVVGLATQPASATSARPVHPVVTSLSQVTGSVAGGTQLVIRGSGFSHVQRVIFGKARGLRVVVASTNKMSVVTPHHAAGRVAVHVVTRYGSSKTRWFTFVKVPKIVTSRLPDGFAHAPYRAVLTASGGTAPYRWRAAGLPGGVTLSRGGRFGGSPTATGTHRVVFVVTDAAGHSSRRTLSLAVPDALPADCGDGTCAHVVPRAGTVEEPAANVLTVDRDTSGAPVSVVLRNTVPSMGQILVIPPVADAPSGLLAKVGGVTDNGDGTVTAAVQRQDPDAAFSTGAAVGSAKAVTASTALVRRVRAHPDDFVSCSTPNVSFSFRKFQVLPELKPTLALKWDVVHGVTLFQVGIEGSLKIEVDMSVSAKTTCTLKLPSLKTTIPVGELGVVVLELTPSVTLDLSGRFSFSTGVTLGCGAFYSYVKGVSTSSSYCSKTPQPFRVGNDTGIDASLTAMVDASAALDDLVGIQGNLTGVLHAGFHPKQHPVAELDAKVTFYLRACLICFGGNALVKLTIVDGTLFQGVLLSYDTPPPGLVAPGPPSILTTGLPDAYQQRAYSAQLDSGGRDGTWSLTGANLPTGLTLASDGTVSGTPTGATGTGRFTVSFTDDQNRTVSAPVTLTVRFAGPPPAPPAPVTRIDITAISPNPATTHEAIQFFARTVGSPVPVNDTVFFCFVSSVNHHLCNSYNQANLLCSAFVDSDTTSACEATIPAPGTYQVYATLNRFDDADDHATKITLVVDASSSHAGGVRLQRMRS